ncbi:hypothetical protein ACH5RR_021478 [Cinchona calisaya]|uniref:Uncharacterized protein n=1 Tax=Cinchona calisaya TaxID=153742 RepID=A0ABD2ZIB9_9GENT
MDQDDLTNFLDSDDEEDGNIMPDSSQVPLPQPPRPNDLDHIYHAPTIKRVVGDVICYQTEYLHCLNWKLDILAWRINLEIDALLHHSASQSNDEKHDKARISRAA